MCPAVLVSSVVLLTQNYYICPCSFPYQQWQIKWLLCILEIIAAFGEFSTEDVKTELEGEKWL